MMLQWVSFYREKYVICKTCIDKPAAGRLVMAIKSEIAKHGLNGTHKLQDEISCITEKRHGENSDKMNEERNSGDKNL